MLFAPTTTRRMTYRVFRQAELQGSRAVIYVMTGLGSGFGAAIGGESSQLMPLLSWVS